jgi:hypothetical protein
VVESYIWNSGLGICSLQFDVAVPHFTVFNDQSLRAEYCTLNPKQTGINSFCKTDVVFFGGGSLFRLFSHHLYFHFFSRQHFRFQRLWLTKGNGEPMRGLWFRRGAQGHLILLRENATFGLFPLRITTSCLLVFYSVSSFTDIICIVMHLHSYPRALHSRVRRSTPPPKLQSTLVYQIPYLYILNIAVIGRETYLFACVHFITISRLRVFNSQSQRCVLRWSSKYTLVHRLTKQIKYNKI